MSRSAAQGDLLYVADTGSDEVDVYTYPAGKPAGVLTGFNGVAFICADKNGNVFIPDYGAHEILEYAHGGTSPIRTLNDSYESPYSCAVDLRTEDLAVANYDSGSGADISVYRDAKGAPRDYSTSFPYFCAYDASSNLYVEGYLKGSQGTYFQFSRLAKGARRFTVLALQDIPAFPNGLQWDGTYLAIGTGTMAGSSTGDTYIYHVAITRSIGRTVGTTSLVENGLTSDFFIDGPTIIVSGGNPVTHTKFFHYPGGGEPTKTLKEGTPAGVVVSAGRR